MQFKTRDVMDVSEFVPADVLSQLLAQQDEAAFRLAGRPRQTEPDDLEADDVIEAEIVSDDEDPLEDWQL